MVCTTVLHTDVCGCLELDLNRPSSKGSAGEAVALVIALLRLCLVSHCALLTQSWSLQRRRNSLLGTGISARLHLLSSDRPLQDCCGLCQVTCTTPPSCCNACHHSTSQQNHQHKDPGAYSAPPNKPLAVQLMRPWHRHECSQVPAHSLPFPSPTCTVVTMTQTKRARSAVIPTRLTKSIQCSARLLVWGLPRACHTPPTAVPPCVHKQHTAAQVPQQADTPCALTKHVAQGNTQTQTSWCTY